MEKEPNERELKLAARVNELSDAEAAPTVAGVGMFSLAVNFLMRRVTKGIMTILLIIVIAYHGWQAFNEAPQGMADLQAKRAEVGQVEAEAAALNAQANGTGGSIQLATLRAEIDKTQAEADQAKADADAQNQMIDGMPAAVAEKKAEVETEEQNVRKVLADHRFIVHLANCYQQGIGAALLGCS